MLSPQQLLARLAELGIAQRTVDKSESRWQRLAAALDMVAGQHDCYASHLFWYTDLDAAKKAAKESGKPILSLTLRTISF